MESRLILVLLCALFLSGCVGADSCAGWAAIRPSSKDKLTEGTTTQILNHNEFGKKQCGWSSSK